MKKLIVFPLCCYCVGLLAFVGHAQDSTNAAAVAPAASTSAVTTPPPASEEARKHFVMGTTLFKDAKTPDDYSQVVSEFKQTTDLAPQWPEARYNLALAKEAAGDYSGAMDDLKLYQKFKLSDAETRTVQDKIYALEAKQQEATKRAADEAKKAVAVANAQAQVFLGKWYPDDRQQPRRTNSKNFVNIVGFNSAELSDGFDVTGPANGDEIDGATIKGTSILSNFQIHGQNVQFTVTTDENWYNTRTGNFILARHRVNKYDLFISENGHKLSGDFLWQEGRDQPVIKINCAFSRRD